MSLEGKEDEACPSSVAQTFQMPQDSGQKNAEASPEVIDLEDTQDDPCLRLAIAESLEQEETKQEETTFRMPKDSVQKDAEARPKATKLGDMQEEDCLRLAMKISAEEDKALQAIDRIRKEKITRRLEEGKSLQGISARESVNGLTLEPGMAKTSNPSGEFRDHSKVFQLKPQPKTSNPSVEFRDHSKVFQSKPHP